MDTSKAEVAAVSAVEEKKSSRTQHGQFNHVATYPRTVSALSGKARKNKKGNIVERKIPRQWTVSDIAKEADREDPEYSPHVKERLKPVLLRGVPPSALLQMCDEMMTDAKQSNGTRAVRSDTHVLLGAVYSLPYRPADYVEHREKCTQFFEDAMAFHEKHYGKIVSAVMHLDEGMIHSHIWTLHPDAKSLVPGWKAKREEMKRQQALGASKAEALRQGNIAYKEAMKAFQDTFFIEVGERNGLSRYGDRRMRYQPGEARAKRLEREEHARMMREREAQAEANRKKIEADRLEQERINAEAAENLAALIEEKKRIDHQAEYVQREKERVERTVGNLTQTPEFIREQKLNEQAKEIETLRQEVSQLKTEVIEKNSYIDKLLSIIRDLKAEVKNLKQKFLNKFR